MNELDLFAAAIALTNPTDRAALLERECAGRPELRLRLDRLLDAHFRSNPLLDQPDFDQTRDRSATEIEKADSPIAGTQAGAVIAGKYTLVEAIGEGGMGSVWRARQTEPVKRLVAVKLIKAGMDSKQVLARFDAERQALALMDHPNIAKVLDGGLHDGRPYFVMELVKGVPITEYCDRHRLPPKERLELFVPVCQAIQHAHQKGIIHRDIKPSNVLIALYDDRPVVKVIDFGVAKATGGTLTEHTIDTGFGAVIGTPQYMSPEQATFNNLDVDTRSDVYALGVLLYELLTGSPPFSKQDLEKRGVLEMLRVVREEEPPRPSTKLSTADALPSLSANRSTEPRRLTGLLRNELDWVVMKALEKDRTRRYETANGFAADVQRYLNGDTVQAHPPSAAYRLRKFARRNRGQVIAASLVLAALLAGVVGTSVGLVRANRSAEAERRAKLDAVAKRQEAERNLAFAKKGNEILGSVFAGLDPKANYATVAELRNALRDNLTGAVKELDGSAIGDPLEVAAMQDTLAVSLLALGETRKAIELLLKALDTRTARLDPEHRNTLDSMGNLGRAYQLDGQLGKAVTLLEQALAKAKSALGADDHDTLAATNNLALAYLHTGQARKAIPLLQRALAITKDKSGPEHPDTLINMGNLAMAYHDDGQYRKAETLLEEVLPKRKVKSGPVHPDTLTTMGNLALVYQAEGRSAEAVTLLEEALAKRKATLGPDHPTTVQSMNNLASAYRADEQNGKAVTLLEEVLAKWRAMLGPDNPETLAAMHNLALAYRDAGRKTQCLTLLEEVLARAKITYGFDHPRTLKTMNSVASTYREAGQPGKAVMLHEQTLAMQKVNPGPDHPDTLNTMYDLGLAYQADGQYRKAVTMLEEVVAKEKATFGHDHRNTLITMGFLGSAYRFAGHPGKAVTLLEEVQAKWKASPKPDIPGTLKTMLELGLAYDAVGQPGKALPLLDEVLTKLKASLGPDNPQTLNVMSLLAGMYRATRQFDKALPLLEEALAKDKAVFGPDHSETLATMNNLAISHRSAGQADKSVTLLEEVLEKRKVKLGPEHPDTLNTMSHLGLSYVHLERLDKGVPLFEEAVAKQKVVLGPDHPNTLSDMGILGKAYARSHQGEKAATMLVELVNERRKKAPTGGLSFAGLLAQVSHDLLSCGQHAAAEPILRECLTIREKVQPEEWTTFNTQSLLGGALLGQKKYAEAEPLLLKGYDGMKTREKAIPQKNGAELRIPEALDRLIELYTATNKADEVKKWQAERAKYPEAKPEGKK